jgi:GH24 family phage-related lysozyme (muramidase)
MGQNTPDWAVPREQEDQLPTWAIPRDDESMQGLEESLAREDSEVGEPVETPVETPIEIDTRDTETFVAHMEESEAKGVDLVSTVSDLLRPELIQAEGEVAKVYQGAKDAEGVLTAGIGHKLTPEELKQFSEGDSITSEQIQTWYEEDSRKAVSASVEQAEEIGVESEEFMSALASVNFQLGTNWNKIHKGTWKLMKEGKFEEAANEAADSVWNTQTPERVEAFQDALRKEAEIQKYSGLDDGWYRDKTTREEFQVIDGRRQ